MGLILKVIGMKSIKENPIKSVFSHCPVCGDVTEREVKFPVFDGRGTMINKKVSIMCTCRKKEQEEQEEYQKKIDTMRTIESLRRLSLMDAKLLNANLSNFIERDDNTRLLKIIKNYIINFEKMYKENQGLLLWGAVGTGKSYAAATIANELLERMTSVVMTSFIKILKEVGKFDEDSWDIEEINNAKLLIIDDLGAERGTDYALEQVYDIIDSRYRSNKPIILTTNLTIEQMKGCPDIRYNRIYDRIFEMCYPVKVSGISWRKRDAAIRYENTRKILEEDINADERYRDSIKL